MARSSTGSRSRQRLDPGDAAVADTALEFFTATDMDYAFGGSGSQRSSIPRPRRSSTRAAPGVCRARPVAPSRRVVRQPLRLPLGRQLRRSPRTAPAERRGRARGAGMGRRATSRYAALRTLRRIDAVTSEFPPRHRSRTWANAPRHAGLSCSIREARRELLTVSRPDGWAMHLVLLPSPSRRSSKRAAFIVSNSSTATRPSGMTASTASGPAAAGRPQPAGPDHLAGNHPYAVSGSDDPSNSKCLLVAERTLPSPMRLRSRRGVLRQALRLGQAPAHGC